MKKNKIKKPKKDKKYLQKQYVLEEDDQFPRQPNPKGE